MRYTTLLVGVVLACACADDDKSVAAEPTEQNELERDECPDGRDQSPIDLPARPSRSDLPDLVADYEDSHVSIVNNGRTIQYSYDAGSILWLGDDAFELLQLHFHARSEHAIAGELSPLELHLVHKDAADELLVVAVLIESGAHNATLDAADWHAVPALGETTWEQSTHYFNAGDLLPGGPTYRYSGSLTAPPCTSDVSWVVFERRLELDDAQIAKFTALYADNFRVLQPLDERVVSFGD